MEFCEHIICNYPGGPQVTAASWPCSFLLYKSVSTLQQW